MPIIYWCRSRGEVHPHVQRPLLHSWVWLLSDSGYVTVEWYIMCQVSDVCRWLQFAFVSNVYIPSCHIWVSCFLTTELISWAPGHFSHMTLSSNSSPCCTVQQPAPSSLQIWLKWLSWFPWKPGAQRSGKIHFTLQQRDKEMVRQRESGRERGFKRERVGGDKRSLTLKDASFI